MITGRERIPTCSELHIPTLHLCHHLFVEAVPQEHMLNEIYTPPAQKSWHCDQIDVPAFFFFIANFLRPPCGSHSMTDGKWEWKSLFSLLTPNW